MSVLGNILWFLLGGLLLGLGYMIAGLVWCITIIGIPFGVQLFKIGAFAMFPFGQTPVASQENMGFLNVVLNIIWILLGGIEMAVMHVVLGVVFCITIIGIPFGLQHFKLAQIALFPFGQTFSRS